MNLTYLKYALEVEKTGSITKAAQHLFMGQPNLSKAIKELEESIGITVFERTSKGVLVTQEGKTFLSQAHHIIEQIDRMEAQYRPVTKPKLYFNISVPRASYVTYAFIRFVNSLEEDEGLEINFKETNSIEAVRNILECHYQLGIMRYPLEYEKYFMHLIEDKAFEMQKIWEFEDVLLMSKEHPLARKESIVREDLIPYIELIHGDLMVPNVSEELKKKKEKDFVKKHILVYERGSQFDLLRQVPTTYMHVSPVPENLLEHYQLVQRRCEDLVQKNKDVLIYSKHHRLTTIEERFIKELIKVQQEMKHIYKYI